MEQVAVKCVGRFTIKGALKTLNPAGPNTLTISGTCNENVVIQGFNRLTLLGKPGATITMPQVAPGLWWTLKTRPTSRCGDSLSTEVLWVSFVEISVFVDLTETPFKEHLKRAFK
jgi:hypothetical protein